MACPTSVLAHNSVAEVEADIQKRDRYVQLTDQVAPDFTLLDTGGQKVRLTDFRGKVVILNFLYSRCKEQCPLHSTKLAIVQRQLAESSDNDEVRFVTIATDTEDATSTVENMRTHGPRYGLDPASWVFLHGGPGRENVSLELADEYGLKFVPTADGEQMHAVVTHLIDVDGRLRARYHGLDFDPVNLTLHAAVFALPAHHIKEESARVLALLRKHWLEILIGFVSLATLTWMALSFYWERRDAQRQFAADTAAASSDGETP